MSTKSAQRKIDGSDLEWSGYLRAPHEAKPTALGLWTTATDGLGRRELVPELIAASIYPGQAATEMVIEHLLMLADSGFLTIYQAAGSEWIALTRPLKTDSRVAWSNCPDPLREGSRTFAAVGGGREGARERAGERVRVEQAERAGRWADWEREQERTAAPPPRPLLMDAPPIGCPEHPHGRFANCGGCGTARRRHDLWVVERRYGEQMESYEQGQGDDDEPF